MHAFRRRKAFRNPLDLAKVELRLETKYWPPPDYINRKPKDSELDGDSSHREGPTPKCLLVFL